MRNNDLISRSTLKSFLCKCCNILHLEDPCEPGECNVMEVLDEQPAVDAVEVTAQELQFLIDAMYRHVRWMIAGRLDKPECSYDERVALLERLTLFEREHFPDMQAETEG